MEAIFKNMRGIVAIITTLGSFALVFTILFKEIPTGNKEVAYMSIGLILGALIGSNTYYFGSSKDKSDQEKASIIKDQNVIT